MSGEFWVEGPDHEPYVKPGDWEPLETSADLAKAPAVPRPSDGQQQAAAEVASHWHETDGLTDRIAAALTEAARPGQELRQRVEELAAQMDSYLPGIAVRLRAALDAEGKP